MPQKAKSRTAGSNLELENEVPYRSQEKSKDVNLLDNAQYIMRQEV